MKMLNTLHAVIAQIAGFQHGTECFTVFMPKLLNTIRIIRHIFTGFQICI